MENLLIFSCFIIVMNNGLCLVNSIQHCDQVGFDRKLNDFQLQQADINNIWLKMFNISSDTLHFKNGETTHSLKIDNSSKSWMIFKIKITNTGLFSIIPGKGFLKEGETSSITIKVNRIGDYNAKILISYAQLQEIPSASFEEIWSKLTKQQIQSRIIPIICSQAKREQPKKDERIVMKQTQSPIYEMELSQSVSQQVEQRNQTNNRRYLLGKTASCIYKSVQNIEQKRVTTLRDSKQMRTQRQLQNQRQKNKRMRDKLLQCQKKLLFYTDRKQLLINKTMNSKQQGQNCFLNYILAAFIFIFIGYLIFQHKITQQTTI